MQKFLTITLVVIVFVVAFLSRGLMSFFSSSEDNKKVEVVENDEDVMAFNSDLGKFYDIKIMPLIVDKEEKEDGVIVKTSSKIDLSKFVGSVPYILDNQGVIRKINFDPKETVEKNCQNNADDKQQLYKISYENQNAVQPLEEILFVSKTDPKDFLKFYPAQAFSDEELNKKMFDVLQGRYDLANSNIQVKYNLTKIQDKNYKFGSAYFEGYKNCQQISADFIFDNDNNISSWRIEEFACNGGGENDIVEVRSGLSIDLQTIKGVISFKSQDNQSGNEEDWIIMNSGGFETSGFALVQYRYGNINPENIMLNHFKYSGCPM